MIQQANIGCLSRQQWRYVRKKLSIIELFQQCAKEDSCKRLWISPSFHCPLLLFLVYLHERLFHRQFVYSYFIILSSISFSIALCWVSIIIIKITPLPIYYIWLQLKWHQWACAIKCAQFRLQRLKSWIMIL